MGLVGPQVEGLVGPQAEGLVGPQAEGLVGPQAEDPQQQRSSSVVRIRLGLG